MNYLNRTLIILLTIAVMAVSLLFCLHILQVISLEKFVLLSLVAEQIRPLVEGGLKTRIMSGGISLCVFFLGAVLLYFELHPIFSRESQFLILKDDLGRVEIAKSCVGKFIDYEVKNLNGVIESSSKIKDKKDGLHIKSVFVASPQTKVSELAELLQNRIKTQIQDKIGLIVSKVAVKAKIGEEPKAFGSNLL